MILTRIEVALCGDTAVSCPVSEIPERFARVGVWTSADWKKPPMQQNDRESVFFSENDFCSRGVRKDGGDADR